VFIVFVNCTLLQALCTCRTAHRWSRGMYSSTLSWPKALEGGEGSASRPGRFLPPGKTRYLLYRRLGGPQGRSGQVRKISHPPEFDTRTVQPVASRYTDWATRPTYCICTNALSLWLILIISEVLTVSQICLRGNGLRFWFRVPAQSVFPFPHYESDPQVYLRNGNIKVYSCFTKQDALKAGIKWRYTARQT
jgi:hypothetical protein